MVDQNAQFFFQSDKLRKLLQLVKLKHIHGKDPSRFEDPSMTKKKKTNTFPTTTKPKVTKGMYALLYLGPNLKLSSIRFLYSADGLELEIYI